MSEASPQPIPDTDGLDARTRSTLDDVDRRILHMLQDDARRTYADLAAEIGLSAPSVHARVKKLERRGTIRRYTIDTAPEQLGFDISALVAVQQQPGFQWERLERAFRLMPAVEACYSVTGNDTYVLLVRVASPAMLEDLLRSTACLEGVANTRTMVILSTTFERRRIY